MFTNMFYCILLLFIITQCVDVSSSQLSKILNWYKLPEDATLNFTGLATKYGHPPLEYKVITEDGYILTLYRLPGRSLYPVLLMHGIYDSCDSFVERGNNSLGITLANDGYDVWFGNSRGNRYSRQHVHLNPDRDARFWNFSFHEMGYYDLPAIIDEILNKTGAPSLTAIAHSQGNTMFFVLGSTRREYNAKINVMMALAPICYLHHTHFPISTLIKLSPFLEKAHEILNVNEFLGDNCTLRRILKTICTRTLVGYGVCGIGITFELCGFDAAELGPRFHRVSSAHFPAGGSVMSALHYLQVGRRRIFARYDFGIDKNRVIYKSSTPPAYNLSKVVMPVALFTGRNDRLSTLADVAILRQQLPNVVYNLLSPRRLMNHVDYLVGRRANKYLYLYIFNLLKLYNGLE